MRILRKTSEALSVSEEPTKPYIEFCNVGDGDISERIQSDASAPVRSVHSRMQFGREITDDEIEEIPGGENLIEDLYNNIKNIIFRKEFWTENW